MSSPDQRQFFGTSMLMTTRQKRMADMARFKQENPDLVRQPKRERDSGLVQQDMHWPDETRAVTKVWGARCPICGTNPFLWAILGQDKQMRFQVRCARQPIDGRPCSMPHIPPEPIADSRGAVRAWKLAVRLQTL